MPGNKVVILDGRGPLDEDLSPVLGQLSAVLHQDGSQIETVLLGHIKLAHCIGCFDCWLKTPGICVENDAGRQIAHAVIQSDTTVFFTPVTFGGYSPDLKRMMDRFIQLISPYFQIEHHETHHPPRYAHRPRLVVGVQRSPNPHEAQIFRTLTGRNAINFHPPSYAAEVVLAADPAASLRQLVDALLGRQDALPFGEPAAALMPPPVDSIANSPPTIPRRALLIVGSPKTSSASTSSTLGNHIVQRLAERGWEIESLTLRPSLNREDGAAALRASTQRAGLILLVFPLYADALPYLVTKALTEMAANRRSAASPPPQHLVAIVNSGVPELHQNAAALAICLEFAQQTGIDWRGGLALPGGGMVGNQPLTAPQRPGPPVQHVVQALDLTAAALAESRPVPAEAQVLLARVPVPGMPFALCRWIYMRFGGRGFEQLAAQNGVNKKRLLDQPYAT